MAIKEQREGDPENPKAKTAGSAKKKTGEKKAKAKATRKRTTKKSAARSPKAIKEAPSSQTAATQVDVADVAPAAAATDSATRSPGSLDDPKAAKKTTRRTRKASKAKAAGRPRKTAKKKSKASTNSTVETATEPEAEDTGVAQERPPEEAPAIAQEQGLTDTPEDLFVNEAASVDEEGVAERAESSMPDGRRSDEGPAPPVEERAANRQGQTGEPAAAYREREEAGTRSNAAGAPQRLEAPPEPEVRPAKAAPVPEARPAPRIAEVPEPPHRKRERPRRRKKRGAVTAEVSKPAPPKVVSTARTGDIAPLRPDDREGSSGSVREMVVNVSAGDECRIAVLENGRLEELFIERENTQSLVGNIYKGRVINVEPSIQAVFVDFGYSRNGFLHISDVQPQYFPNRKGEVEDVGRKIPRHSRPPIQECFRRGQSVIVQVTKAGVGTKGPTLTTYLSIPGRFLVMMPGMNRLGVSRKIEDEEARRKMRDLLAELQLPQGMGFILRTAGLDRTKRDLQRDLNYLMRLWKKVAERVKSLPAPAELYRESDLVTRTIRDVYTSDFARLVVDDAETAEKAREFLDIAMPRLKPEVVLYTAREPLFHRFGLEREIEKINMRQVPLPSGGSIVIDATEAMVAIDVNSGRFRSPEDAEETALRINLEAGEEIARQLRLRDLGGLIVCDFIDMRYERNKRAVEKTLREALKKHKERARILRMSAFGLIEITRQRRGPSIRRNIYFDCPHCKGTGAIKTTASVMLDVMRIIQLAAHREDVYKVTVTVSNEVAYQILNAKRKAINDVEVETGTTVIIRGDASVTSDDISFRCEDVQGRTVNFLVSGE
jgi:ribonuclease E